MSKTKISKDVINQEVYDHLVEKFGEEIVKRNYILEDVFIHKIEHTHPFRKFL